MCGCENCIHCKQLQRTLNSWRKRHAANKNRYKFVVFPDGNVLHESTRDAANTMIFQNDMVPFYLTGSVYFENMINVQSIMFLNMNQAVQLLFRKLNFIFMFYSQLVLFMD